MPGTDLTPSMLHRMNRPNGLRADEMVISHHNPWQLRTLLRGMVERGEVAVAHPMVTEKSGRGYVLVRRLRPPTRRTSRTVAAVVAVLGCMVTIALLLWSARYFVGGALLLAALWWGATRRSHRGVCTGLHCDGCKP